MIITPTQMAIRIISEGARNTISRPAVVAHEITRRISSREWKWMCIGNDYYHGRHDVLQKRRTTIGPNGELLPLENLPNSQFVDNQYRKMVKQKTNYLLGKPFTITSGDASYNEQLAYYFDKRFMADLRTLGKDSLNCGIAWIYVYYDENGQLSFKRFRPYEVIPGWRNVEHTELDYVIRFYDIAYYDGSSEKKRTNVELYLPDGIHYYQYQMGQVQPCAPYQKPYQTVDGIAYNWERLPFVAFKYNEEEIPLIAHCKSLQDGVNTILSHFGDNMQEDARNTILVLVNYDGENLGEFRQKLAQYGAVKISTTDGIPGDVRTLQMQVNSENYKAVLSVLKRAIIDNCMGYDARDDRLSTGSPNQMNIAAMYNDIAIDASEMETEYQVAMDDLLYFLDLHLLNTGVGDFTGEEVRITFNTAMPVNESLTIQDVRNSVGILSNETLLEHHPYVTDAAVERERLKSQRREEARELEDYAGAFPGVDGLREREET